LFCLDTSALLDAGTRWYPRDLFPSLWTKLTEAADNDVIVSPDEVLRELSKKDDEVYAWAKAQSKMFVPLDEDVQKTVRDILAKFPRLVDTMKDRSQADPFVIAVAKVTKRIVVTGEKAVGSTQRPRIPNVCAQYGIEYINIVEFIRRQKWNF
jgi:hypothetical protein